MYLSMPNAVINDARPSRIKAGMHEIFGCLDVNGLATDASVSLKLTPACAAFNAPQSFALFQSVFKEWLVKVIKQLKLFNLPITTHANVIIN